MTNAERDETFTRFKGGLYVTKIAGRTHWLIRKRMILVSLTEWLGIGGFILGVVNLATHIYIQFLRKPKLDIEIIEPSKIVSNKPGQAHVQVSLRLKVKHGPVYLRMVKLQHESPNGHNLSIITPQTQTPQHSMNSGSGVDFNITHVHTFINHEISNEIIDLVKIWNETKENFIDIREMKVDKDEVKSFTVLASIFGSLSDYGLKEDVEVKGWQLVLEYDKRKVTISIPGTKLVTQYV
ncbi:hypothetical protein [Brevibacillus reuszeri]|uniref:hypothetical protein n=1 Tax=Brevibacillus reuszeri TaxID=54915 RepID=UPI0013E004E7|nr:hypothetical protein [Brevibacillus reuszeri]